MSKKVAPVAENQMVVGTVVYNLKSFPIRQRFWKLSPGFMTTSWLAVSAYLRSPHQAASALCLRNDGKWEAINPWVFHDGTSLTHIGVVSVTQQTGVFSFIQGDPSWQFQGRRWVWNLVGGKKKHGNCHFLAWYGWRKWVQIQRTSWVDWQTVLFNGVFTEYVPISTGAWFCPSTLHTIIPCHFADCSWSNMVFLHALPRLAKVHDEARISLN